MSLLSAPMIILLDSGPLGLFTNPNAGANARNCKLWYRTMVQAGHVVLVPEIIDYEHRRELLLAGLHKARQALDDLKDTGSYLPLTTAALLRAAQFWADVRRVGVPTADRFALDADVILAGQAATLDSAEWGMPGAGVLIATTNVGHLTRFANAEAWHDIKT